ncbi:unnamed protein product [Rangifer tarandus platyrhynchus]|uniref:Uncharacterized protein n=1 Tax=Rangifer tarandus platyrhynchus TaxID=3082113 RepID=A0ABN8Y3E6_RANTA|nr:unnamed protein product [Rangifer tarandus platyrhynchus]
MRSPGGQNTAVVLRPVSFIEPTVLLASGLRGPGFTSHVWTPSLGGGEGPGSLPGNRPGGCAEGGDEWHPRQTCALGSWPLGGASCLTLPRARSTPAPPFALVDKATGTSPSSQNVKAQNLREGRQEGAPACAARPLATPKGALPEDSCRALGALPA